MTSEIDIIDLLYLRYIQNFQRVIIRYSRRIKFKKGWSDRWDELITIMTNKNNLYHRPVAS